MKEIIKLILLIFFALFYRVKIVHRENMPRKGAAILCANHIGEIDMLLIGYRIKRLVHYMAKQELFKNPLFSLLIRYLGAFPVKRGKADVEAIKFSLKLLKDGHILGIFPEGTRTGKNKTQPVRVKPGIALLAQKSGAPIIPVAIKGSYKPFSRIYVIFGEPFTVHFEEDKKYSNEELIEISRDIMGKVYALMG